MIEVIATRADERGLHRVSMSPAVRANLKARGYSFTYDDLRQVVTATPPFFGARRVYSY